MRVVRCGSYMALEVEDAIVPIENYKITSQANGTTWLEVGIRVDSTTTLFETSTSQES